MKRFAEFDGVIDFIAEYICELGFYADDFDLEALAFAIAVADDERDGYRVFESKEDKKAFRRMLPYYEVD